MFMKGNVDEESKQFTGEFKKKLLRKRNYSSQAGIDQHIDRTNEAFQSKFKDQMEALSLKHGRTMDPEAYAEHSALMKESEKEMLEFSNSSPVREQVFLNSIHKQRYWANVVNFIFTVNDVMNPGSDKAPVIVFGDGKFKGGSHTS